MRTWRGFKRTLSDTSTLLYAAALGRFGKTVGEDGTLNSVIYTNNLSDNLTFISQTDVLYTDNSVDDVERNTFGNINYLIYKVNDCVSFGQRFEWFNYGGNSGLFAGRRNDDLYNYTAGFNLRPTANLVFRPEVRWVWDRADGNGLFLENGRSSQAIFGTDMVLTF